MNNHFEINLKAKTCGTNEVYELRAECSKTCLFPDGNNDCGLVNPIEGCYCKAGFVLDAANQCVAKENCGCVLPDKSGIIAV